MLYAPKLPSPIRRGEFGGEGSMITWLNSPARALVVGINEYEAKSIGNLQGGVPDARAVAQFLVDDLGMARENILLLTSPASGENEQRATRAAILYGLRNFLKDAPQGSHVLFYYSGHGSYTKLAPDISFGDQQGETLVPADARVNTQLDILDREMRVIREELKQRKLYLTVIADSCFSGDVMRGDPDISGPAVPRLTGEPHGGPRTLDSLLDGTVTQEALQALYTEEEDSAAYTLIAGCLDNQQSYEASSATGERRGVMTTALLEALRSAQGALTYEEVARLLTAFVPAKRLEKQVPNVTGNTTTGMFGTILEKRAHPLFPVHTVLPKGTIEFRAGLVAGVDRRSLLTLYRDWSLQESIGTYRVSEAKPHSTTAAPTSGEALPLVGQPLQLDSPSRRLSVYFAPTATKIQAAWYEDKKVGIPQLWETRDAASAEYTVIAEHGEYIAQKRDGKRIPYLRQRQDDPRARHELARRLNLVACYESFVMLAPTDEAQWNVGINTPNGVTVALSKLEGDGTSTPMEMGGEVLPAKPRLQLQVENHTDQEVWAAVYLLDQPSYVTERLFPADNQFHLSPAQKGNHIRSAVWNGKEWGGGLLPLKIVVSSEPILPDDLPRFPCGTRDVNRGARLGGEDTLGNSGWSVTFMTMGLPS